MQKSRTVRVTVQYPRRKVNHLSKVNTHFFWELLWRILDTFPDIKQYWPFQRVTVHSHSESLQYKPSKNLSSRSGLCELCWLLPPGSISLLSGSTLQPENTYCCILRWPLNSEIAKKGWASILIIATTSPHLLKPVLPDPTKNQISFSQPNRKRQGARLVDVIKHLFRKVFLLWHHQ